MTQWYKKHPQFFESEKRELAANGNYKEHSHVAGNLFLSQGEIIVRLQQVLRYPVLVAYTNATPYHLPAIFPLKALLTDEQLAALAQLEYPQFNQQILPYVHFYYQYRHQNGSGALCILEADNLDSLQNFYGISTVLKRVRDWYAAHTTGRFPPDSEEVAFYSHFTRLNDELTFLYGDLFLNPDLVAGDFYATLFSHIPKLTYILKEKRTFIGVYIEGIGANGLVAPESGELYYRIADNRLKTSVDLLTKTDVVEELIHQKELIRAQWFHINAEPAPFQTVNDLVTLIGGGDYEAGVARVTAQCLPTFKNLVDFFFLAIRFPNRKGHYEFQLFKIYKAEEVPKYQDHQDPQQKMKNVLTQYEQIEAVRSDMVTKETYHQRNGKRADLDIMSAATVCFFGVGALGSEMADCIAKAGVADIGLLDNQRITIYNPIRHLAGTDMIDQFKVGAVAQILKQHHPYINVHPMPLDLMHHDFESAVPMDALAVCSIADDNVEGYVNQQMVISNRPAFYVRALRGGKTARIFRVIPGIDACFYCLQLYREQGQGFIEIPEDPDYPTLRNECNNPVRPASAADLKTIAAITSRLVIDHLHGKNKEVNHWIWTTEAIEDTPLTAAYSMHTQHLPPHDNCPYCHHSHQLKISIAKDCLATMQALVMEAPTIETGGVLAGSLTQEGQVVVTHVSGPGPLATKSAHEFEKDLVFCQKFIDDLFAESGGTIYYVGEWHSHPSTDTRPSSRDQKSLSSIASQPEYQTNEPVMIILSNEGKPTATAHPAGKRFYSAELTIQ